MLSTCQAHAEHMLRPWWSCLQLLCIILIMLCFLLPGVNALAYSCLGSMHLLLLAWGQCISFFLPGVNAFASSCLGSMHSLFLAWGRCIRFFLLGVSSCLGPMHSLLIAWGQCSTAWMQLQHAYHTCPSTDSCRLRPDAVRVVP